MDEKLKDFSALLNVLTTDHMIFVISLASMGVMAFALYVIMQVVTKLSKGRDQ